MNDEEIKFCPFRTVTETFPAAAVGNGDVTRTNFERCLKESCPAFYIAHGGDGQRDEGGERLQ